MSEWGWGPAERRAPGRPWWTRLGWIGKLVLSLGALATAVSAIVALLPSADPEDSARFTSVRTTPQVPISEYNARTVSALDVRTALLLSAQVSPAALGSETQTVPPAPSPLPTLTPAVTPEPKEVLEVTLETGAHSSREVKEATLIVAQALDPYDFCLGEADCTEATEAVETTIQALTSATPAAASPQEAAEALLEMLNEVRTVETEPVAEGGTGAAPGAEGGTGAAAAAEGGTGAAPAAGAVAEPVGVVLGLDVELVGLRGRPVLLTWSLWTQGGGTRLFGQWLETNPTYRLLPSSQRDTTTLELWVPLPRDPGPYFVRLTLSVDDAAVAGAGSEPVH